MPHNMRKSLIDIDILKKIFEPYKSFVEVDNDGDIDVYVYGSPDSHGWGDKDNFNLSNLLQVLNIIKFSEELKGLYDDEISSWVNPGYYGSTEDVYLTFSQIRD